MDLLVELTSHESTRRVLIDEEASDLARLAARVENHYDVAQGIEWSIVDGEIWRSFSRDPSRSRPG